MELSFSTKLRVLFEAGELSPRCYSTLQRLGVETLGDLLARYQNMNELLRQRNFGKKSLKELYAIVDRLNESQQGMDAQPSAEPTAWSDQDWVRNSCSPMIRELLLEFYYRFFRTKDNNIPNPIDRVYSFPVMVSLLGKPIEAYKLVDPCSDEEAFEFNAKLQAYVRLLRAMSPADLCRNYCRAFFMRASDAQVEQMTNDYVEKGILPTWVVE